MTWIESKYLLKMYELMSANSKYNKLKTKIYKHIITKIVLKNERIGKMLVCLYLLS